MEVARYLGDSVYIRKADYGYEIYLDNGMGEHSMIALEPDVMNNLIKFVNMDKV